MYVYAYFNKNNKVLYVGSTRHILGRYQQHECEDEWMSQVHSITVWGPYSEKDGLLSEKVLIANLCPRYNLNTADGYIGAEAPVVHEDGVSFQHFNAMKHHFKTLPGETKRCTYYIYNEEDEALRILSFYYDKPISEIVRTILHNGILKMAEDINLPNIFDIASQRLAGNTNPPQTELLKRDTPIKTPQNDA